jgi:hypothetical protein
MRSTALLRLAVLLTGGDRHAAEDLLQRRPLRPPGSRAACLADAPAGAIADRLARYESLRIPRTAEVQRGSRGNAGILHLPDGPAQRRRDAQMAVHAALRDRAALSAHETGRSVVPVPA